MAKAMYHHPRLTLPKLGTSEKRVGVGLRSLVSQWGRTVAVVIPSWQVTSQGQTAAHLQAEAQCLPTRRLQSLVGHPSIVGWDYEQHLEKEN